MNEDRTKEVKDLVRQLNLSRGNPATSNWGHTVFLIGAGCSFSAGIPLAADIAKSCVLELANKYSQGRVTLDDPEIALNWLLENDHVGSDWNAKKPAWGSLYGKIFGEHFQSDIDQKRIINDAIAKGNNRINWAHICLGELVRRGYVHTVLTTNFDQLVLRGIIKAGIIPVIADGIESLTRIDSRPQTPQVVHIHGSMHTYSVRNSVQAVTEIGNKLPVEGMMYSLLKDSKLLVVAGYAGGEEAVMDLLIKSATHFDNMVVYWATYGTDYESLSNRAKELMGKGNYKFVMTKCDADSFFAEIMEGLGIGVPDWMDEPVNSLLEQSNEFAETKNPDIKIKIENHQSNIRKLEDCWESERLSTNVHDEIASLRLEGKFSEALSKLEGLPGETLELFQQKAETAFEAGQNLLSKVMLEKSVSYWQNALRFVTKESSAVGWSDVQFGLGKSLQLLFEIEPHEQFLVDATIAYRSAIGVDIFKANKEKFTKAQNNRGIALLSLFDFDQNPTHINEAIAAHSAALEVIDREETPALWAETQSNLAGALQSLGDLNNDPKTLERAIETFELALAEYTRSKYPTDWAETQSNLAGVYQRLGEMTGDLQFLRKAIHAYELALKVYTSETNENRAWALNGLGNALATVGENQNDSRLLEEANEIFQRAAKFFADDQNSEMVTQITGLMKAIETRIESIKESNQPE